MGWRLIYIQKMYELNTSIVEDCVFKGAVLKEGVCWSDVLKITVLKSDSSNFTFLISMLINLHVKYIKMTAQPIHIH